MPELPEVETLVKILNFVLKGLTPVALEVKQAKIFRSPSYLSKALRHPIKEVKRRGKLIMLVASPYVWLIHLKMTGQLWWQLKTTPYPPHTHLILSFAETEYQLRYADLRQFGYWQIVSEKDLWQVPYLKRLGPEALSIDVKTLWQRLQKHKIAIKKLLLDQHCLAGLGNIYSDEALWLARIHPLKPANLLCPSEVKRLGWAIKKALVRGIKFQGSSIRDYLLPNGQRGRYQNHRLVYGREGKPCFRCGSLIEKIKIGGRSTHFCPNCQRLH